MSGDMLAVLGAGFQIFILLIQEFRKARDAAAAADAEFNLEKSQLKAIVDSAVQAWATRNAIDSATAGAAWDQADRDHK